jgi:hypothetical protein
MNEQQLAAVKQALEALESERDKYLEWGDEDGAPEDVYEAITALQSIISQDALDKKAESARELGLSYDDAPKIGCVNHDCDQCKAVQEPVAKVYRHGESGNGTPWHGIKWLDEGVNMPDGTLLYTTPPAAQPAPVQEPEQKPMHPELKKMYEDFFDKCFKETVDLALDTTPPAPQPDYAWPTIEDYEKEVGFEVNIAFRSAWAMARTTNDLFNQMGENT